MSTLYSVVVVVTRLSSCPSDDTYGLFKPQTPCSSPGPDCPFSRSLLVPLVVRPWLYVFISEKVLITAFHL